ncbi:DUF1648 domain-containing protein [Streptococcus sobrinus]|uniref:DUF1648 domain-containing protein n=2 Tax=Streptococcus sobrinus TaxID=1310 RepID=U2KHD7_9STRE|nr:DUF1648 domain-containing protein [Streptococcus sobrinus]AWN18908.1 DUF1648 domain-containing protein [Streptococcus sobrinus]AWN20814.1 DUF1648 domain-containing protein [Streptococcus sobrinus]AWN61626.1 DUF1648 domain-containing protein [Streptococcus sobrinus]AWN63497.1 DUF1648 domain-containing protein [Streptococcus sobrinus]EMP71911.1 hypothetical protein D823_06083 [Streptococcus sobrinus DSM 20742 = ATCC 33478]
MKIESKDIFVLCLSIIVILIICQFLPNWVPVHFNSKGEVDFKVYKYFLVFAAVIPYSLYYKYFRKKGE